MRGKMPRERVRVLQARTKESGQDIASVDRGIVFAEITAPRAIANTPAMRRSGPPSHAAANAAAPQVVIQAPTVLPAVRPRNQAAARFTAIAAISSGSIRASVAVCSSPAMPTALTYAAQHTGHLGSNANARAGRISYV